MYNEGISVAGDMLDLGVVVGSLEKRGNSYVYGEEKLGVGREVAKQYLREHPETMDRLRVDTREAALKAEGLAPGSALKPADEAADDAGLET
jgi:recombination protein RecA